MSRGPTRAVVDTVVLRYFLLVERWDLLTGTLGETVVVPRIVFDPDEGNVPEMAMSEVTRSIFVQRRYASDRTMPDEDRDVAARWAERLSRITDHHESGDVEVADMTPDEHELFARLTGRTTAQEFDLVFGLDPGEAACLAIAVERGLVLATDDSDVFKAIGRAGWRLPYQRIRRMLIQSAEEGLIARNEANAVHAEMCDAGFRDKEAPFPGD